jgi:endogenous inhibitor of DNA gyrase (YacG/DUF329 family)
MVEKKVRALCLHCGKVIHWNDNPYRPFCSQRCKLIDLGKWIEEEYRIFGEKTTPEEMGEGRGKGAQ